MLRVIIVVCEIGAVTRRTLDPSSHSVLRFDVEDEIKLLLVYHATEGTNKHLQNRQRSVNSTFYIRVYAHLS